MKKCVILFLVGLLLTSFSTASALELKGKFAVSGDGILTIPVGDYADKEKGAATTRFGFSGNFEYYLTDNIALGGKFSYTTFGTYTDNMEAAYKQLLGVPVDINMTKKGIGYGIFGKYLFPVDEKVSPYVRFGVGMGKPTSSGEIKSTVVSGDIDADFDSKFYLGGGGGILYQVSPNVGLYSQAMFIHLTSDGAKGEVTIANETSPSELDFNMQALFISAGLSYFFGGK